MAANDAVPAVRSTILNGDVDANRSNSSSINKKLAGNINAITQDGKIFTFTGTGYFVVSNPYTAIDGVVRLDRDFEITQYVLTIDRLADNGSDTVSINIGVYDSDDVFINNMFGSGTDRLLVSANSDVTGVAVGRNLLDATTIDEATVGLTTKQFGNPNFSVLEEGWKLRCFLESANGNSKTFRLDLKVA